MTASAGSATAEWRSFWTLPVAAGLGYSTAVLHTYAIGPFFEPLQEEFGWTRAFASLGVTIAGLVAAAFSIPVGMLVDRWGPRPIALTGVILMTAAFASFGTATGDPANWIFLWCLLAFANLWLQTTVWTSAVATRFEHSRGLAFAITFSGASVSAAIFPKLATWLIGEYGWRTAFAAMGGIWLVLVFPFVLLFFRGAQDKDRRVRAATLAASSDLPGLTVREGLSLSAFYKLFIATALFGFTALGIIVHFVPMLRSLGADLNDAASIAALIGIFSIIGRLGTGFMLDRWPGHVVGALTFLLPLIASALLLYDGADPVSQSAAAAIFGFTIGAEVDVIGYLASRHFGLKKFGVLFGAMVGALSLGVAFGPLAAGMAYDRYGGYAEFLMLTIVCMAVGSVALATLGRPRFGVQAHGSTLAEAPAS